MLTIRQLISGNKLARHLAFCLAVAAILVLGVYLLHAGGFRFSSMTIVSINCLFFIAYVYAGRWLCARFYLRQLYGQFIAYTLFALFGLAYIDLLLLRYAFGYPNAGYIELLYGSTPFFAVGMIMGMLLKLIRTSMQKELQEADYRARQKESELGLLQAQLSPHFLFNVLNNLYGISIEERERVPQLLLKLSQLLRYSVYGGKKAFAPLKEELNYIKNYIEFEQIRISDRLELETDIPEITQPDVKIASMALIVFIENAFKHARNATGKKIYIRLSLKTIGDYIRMELSNSFEKNELKDDFNDENSGLGLANTIKRLDLLYENDYSLNQFVKDDRYFVELNLKIKHE